MASFFRHLLFSAVVLAGSVSAASAAPTVLLKASKGDVQVRVPGAKAYASVDQGARLSNGTRLRTGAGAEATLIYDDGSQARVHPKSEIIVRASNKPKTNPNGAVLFLGRIWSKVAKSAGGDTSFEVRSANAVAGVRGTEFEVGVGLDGAAMVRVKEGTVGVEGDDEAPVAEVKGGYTVVSSGVGRLGKVGRAKRKFRWVNFFTRHARQMEKRGLKVARSLDGRLNRRRAKVEKLIAKQRMLRKKVESLGARRKRGENVTREMVATVKQMRKVNARLEDMRARLEGAFGLFERWNEAAQGGKMANAGKIRGMANNIAKIAADFADMIEEGTDLSEEGMDDLMNDMSEGKMTGPGDSAADELFK